MLKADIASLFSGPFAHLGVKWLLARRKERCQTCLYWSDGVCRVFDPTLTRHDDVCDRWEKAD